VAAEQLAAEAGRPAFDVVVASEVIEHVRRPADFVATLAALTAPHGSLVITTLNRTPLSYAVAILGAERLLRAVPEGTHDWARFLTPQELALMGADAGLALVTLSGAAYNPLTRAWLFTDLTEVNYMASFRRRQGGAAGGDEGDGPAAPPPSGRDE
jgi:ubiquinone biosynthesis O-methyltransferase